MHNKSELQGTFCITLFIYMVMAVNMGIQVYYVGRRSGGGGGVYYVYKMKVFESALSFTDWYWRSTDVVQQNVFLQEM